MVGDPVLQEPKWLVPGVTADPEVRAELDGIVYPWLLARTRQEVWAAARKARALVAPLFSSLDVVNDPVFRERGLWTEVEHAVLGTFPMLSRPYILEKTPWSVRSAAPMLGEHTRTVLGEAFSAAEIDALYAAGVVA
jgi:crotonobetainyl-CoA:carnitine CoA-transferase CaiB-like acyl-CoA transferase